MKKEYKAYIESIDRARDVRKLLGQHETEYHPEYVRELISDYKKCVGEIIKYGTELLDLKPKSIKEVRLQLEVKKVIANYKDLLKRT